MSNFAYGKAEDKEHFYDLDIFSNNYLEKEIPTNDGDGSNLPTSIPSPFARIDLVKSAFSQLGKDGVNLDGIVNNNGQLLPSDNHKLVSDALDIGQLFFNFERHRDILTMTCWNREEQLKKLSKQSSKHAHLAKTLELFFNQDSPKSSSYNFHLFSNIYILKYNHKVVGATSPRTLFFAAPDAFSIPISFGTDQMLDDKTRALYKRDDKFIELFYALHKKEGFSDNFPEVNRYIKQNLKKLEQYNFELWSNLKNLDIDEYWKNTPNLLFNNNDGTPVEIINGLAFKQRADNPDDIYKISDFVIHSSKFQNSEDALPLVLPVDTFIHKWLYASDVWDPETKAPCYDELPLNNRSLPGQGVKYPYLTMNDFLADEIIKLPKEINTNYFYSIGDVNEQSYLFPLTPIFFNYFSTREIIENKMITYKMIGDALEVTLRIPTRKGLIVYTKLYYPKASINDNSDKRKGVIMNKSFNLSIVPPVKKQANVPINYYVGISDNIPDSRALPLVNFYNSEESYDTLPLNTINEGERKEGNKAHKFKPEILPSERGVRLNASRSYNQQTRFSNAFDTIVVTYGNIENVIIPIFKVDSELGGSTFEFAIDLGTTNTHIECSIPNSSSSEPFNIRSQQAQIAFLFRDDGTDESSQIRELYDAQDQLIQESINKTFGQKKQDMYESPFRTVMLHNRETKWKSAKVINQANIGFDYEKKTIRPNLEITSNIKWNTDEKGRKLLELTVEELLLLCKNRVLLSKGNVSETKISWLYPVSMGGQLDVLQEMWDDKYTEIFGGKLTNVTSYPESIAPFYEFDGRVQGSLSISIDIGGGTTDVLINQNNKTELISSFKFAGNAIYGGGTMVKNNKFIGLYAKKANIMLEEQQLTVPATIFQSILDNNKGKSEDVMSYLFSLKENKYLKDKGIDYDVAKALALDEDAKMLFLLFFSALIYHIAEITKLQGLSIPRNLMFSGNGSKMLHILDTSRGQKKLNELSLLIFQKVFKTEEDCDLDILISNNPKAMTAKGALRIAKEAEESTDGIDYVRLIRVHSGIIDNTTLHNPRRKKVAPGLSYAEVEDNSSSILNDVLKNYETFISMFSDLDDELNFRDTFSISLNALENVTKLKNKDTEVKLNNAVSQMKKDRQDKDLIDETLFFYPIMALIENLSNTLEE